MEGFPDPPELRGILPQAFKHIFDTIDVDSHNENTEFLVRASYLEIYNENVKDLLSKNPNDKLDIRENSDR